jgi:hypothetical protein
MRASTILAMTAPIWVAACGGGKSNSASGQLGFNVAWAGSLRQTDDNGAEILEVILADKDLSGICTGSNGSQPSGDVQLLIIGLGSIGPVVPGDYPTYAISGSPPPDTVSKVSVAQLAIASPTSSDPTVLANSLSGNVTLSATDEHNSKGTFDMTMVLPDGGPAGKLSGTFDADTCAIGP